MKKSYINPEMDIVKIAADQHILAGSLPKSEEEVNGGLSRKFLFDDDFEDEYEDE